MEHPLFIALDMSSKAEAEDFLKRFDGRLPALKVGMELFYTAGPAFIHNLKERGHPLFLDVKCHDIPKTVERTMKQIAGLGVDLVTTHALGGTEMMEAAREGLEQGQIHGQARTKCIAVTALTSMTEQMLHEQLLIQTSLDETVRHLAKETITAGLDGVVCSVHEVRDLRRSVADDIFTLTPGIRMAGADTHDQKRSATPETARAEASSAIVVGRAITESVDPVATYDQIYERWHGLS
ncbi:orotidine 5'-phosphate decarboxylase [Geomicrobium sp. JCM 19037]|uniref:orotidine-5'-phosphate decarboxylase n=1 Tax=Geomicrobium sp. JCM 19037 TaxID=1460634 RepID=UPI00045F35E2|nr:orotidine-5'-phosphate decarboxylase [Geomicrobium sp. JCM 19037]GAK04644.1 orotidine 5'-phosphate decarboxylase [Geomicrobium sp. JCM 19037]